MILNLFALGPEVTPAVKEAETVIENAFKQILDEEHGFLNFTNEKAFLDAISAAVADGSIVVACAEPEYFGAFKKFIANTFNLKVKPAKAIVELIRFAHPELMDDFIAAEATVPNNSVPLVTQDGLYSGFGIKAKKQLLIVLPLDDSRIDYIVNNSLPEFVRKNMDLSVLISDPLSGMTEEESPLNNAPKKTKRDGLYDELLIKNCVDELKKGNKTVSLADTKTVDFIEKISTSGIDLSEVFFLSGYSVKKENMTAREYAINLAKGALINSSDSFGAAITKVFSMPDAEGLQHYFMYICVTDGDNANVTKLKEEEGETPPQLIYRAVEELFRTIYQLLSPVEKGKIVAGGVNAQAAKAQDGLKFKKIKIAVASLFAAGGIASIIISFAANNIYGVL